MTAVERVQTVPFVITEYGTIRIADSRVSLDSVIHKYKAGAIPEEIVLSFPSLHLSDVYSVIAYYLTHTEEIEQYLQQQKAEADELQRQIESDPKHQAAMAVLRERIALRRKEMERQQV
ncbi:MAG: DUF433 domain-containing protein [Acidobacteriota bacterium]